jgi:hypothetical protein
VGIGQLPAATSALGLLGGVKVGPSRIELHATAWLPRDAASEAQPGTGAEFHRYSFDARACYGPRVGALDVAACLGGRFAWLDAEGFGTPNTMRAGEPQVGPLGGVLVEWPFSARWALRAEAMLSAQLLERHRFVLYREDVLYRPPLLTAEGGLGLELRF